MPRFLVREVDLPSKNVNLNFALTAIIYGLRHAQPGRPCQANYMIARRVLQTSKRQAYFSPGV